MKTLLLSCVFLGSCLASLACSSIKSTHVVRTGNEGVWETRHLHGIPTTLKVPHHYEVRIVEIYHEINGNVLRDGQSRKPITTVDVEFKVVEAEEVFTVDFVRPGAGELKTKLSLDADKQYFTEIDNKITDNTIDEITKSIKALSDAINPLSTKRNVASVPGAKAHKKVLATLVVDVKDSTAKEQIHEFLSHHLNSCTNCETKPGTRIPSSGR